MSDSNEDKINEEAKLTVDTIKNTIEPTGSVFTFKENVDMNALTNQIGSSMAETIGSNSEDIECKGLRIFYVDKKTDLLMSSGLFVKGFSPEDWDD